MLGTAHEIVLTDANFDSQTRIRLTLGNKTVRLLNGSGTAPLCSLLKISSWTHNLT